MEIGKHFFRKTHGKLSHLQNLSPKIIYETILTEPLGSAQESKDSLGYKIPMEIQLLTITGIYMHMYSDKPSLPDLRDLFRDD
jgi:hypothetical protein